MRYPYDPELAAAVVMMPEVDISDVPAARAAQAEQLADAVSAADEAGVDVEEVRWPGPEGAPDVMVRIYRPRCVRGPLPAILSLHGGGYVVGSPDVDHAWNLMLSRELPALVVSVDYRLAPEHPFPAGLEDCYAVLCRLAKDATELGIRADRIAVGGDSAGAGLAAGLALLARDRGGPDICFQLLMSPELDDRLATPSALEFTDTPVWNRRNARLSWDAYLGPGVPGSAGVPPYAAPARAGSAELAGAALRYGPAAGGPAGASGPAAGQEPPGTAGPAAGEERPDAAGRPGTAGLPGGLPGEGRLSGTGALAGTGGLPGAEGLPGAGGLPGTVGLAGLPPAYVSVMQFDPLRDEGVDYARALLAAGVPAELHLFPGTFHGAVMVTHSDVAQRITAGAVGALRRVLAR